MTTRHKVFISYHHANDQRYRDLLVNSFGSAFDDWSVRDGEIADDLMTDTIRRKIRDEWLRDSTVTVVLVGAETWKRKHVDWEIYSSLRDTQFNSRSGLLGILLPTYPRNPNGTYDINTIPPRLADNIQGHEPFARLYSWPSSPAQLETWVHEAYGRRKSVLPINARELFGKNRSTQRWV